MEREFDRYAADYDELIRDPIRDRFAQSAGYFHARKWDVLRRFFRKHGFDLKRSAWLDLGCGKGDLLQLGISAFAQVTGCDPSPNMLGACPGLQVRLQSSATELPFDDNAFDLVTAVCVYHHVELADRAALTKDVYRVLKPGGIFCMIEHNPLNPVTLLIVKRAPVDADAHLLTAGASRRITSAVGFKSVETTYFIYFPERFYARLKTVENGLARLPLGGQYATFAMKPRDASQ